MTPASRNKLSTYLHIYIYVYVYVHVYIYILGNNIYTVATKCTIYRYPSPVQVLRSLVQAHGPGPSPWAPSPYGPAHGSGPEYKNI